jgi:ribosome maturation factor RimP
MKVADLVWQFSEPVVQELGCSIWDVEYVREGGEWFLRIYIDKEGGVDINACEAVSRAIDPILDEKDPIADPYTFEVCSAGLERALKRPRDFEQFLGSPVVVKLYRARNGVKEFTGTLTAYEDGDVTITVGDKPMKFEKAEVALCRLYAEF